MKAVAIDFDGTLVETEQLHYNAYNEALPVFVKEGPNQLPYTFEEYANLAHVSDAGGALRTDLERRLPGLRHEDWDQLYKLKNKSYLDQCRGNPGAQLRPGVAQLLTDGLPELRCIVTNSPREQLETVCSLSAENNVISQCIPPSLWFTRDTYDRPKPYPDCYVAAVESMYNKSGGSGPDDTFTVTGIEDTPKGLGALMCARAHFAKRRPNVRLEIVFVTEVNYHELDTFLLKTLKECGFPEATDISRKTVPSLTNLSLK